MLWLVYCGFFVLTLISIFRALMKQGKWAWGLFLGLIASGAAYAGLFVVPVASAAALQHQPVLLAAILIGGTLLYIGLMLYGIRRVAAKMKPRDGS